MGRDSSRSEAENGTATAYAAAAAAFAAGDLVPHSWSNARGFRHGERRHPDHKVVVCVAGSITFHTPDGDLALRPGGGLDLPAGTAHSATVGPDGVTCMEAYRNGDPC